MKISKGSIFYTAWLLFSGIFSHAQEVPSAQEGIPYLVTFGQNSDHSWGDDDFSQTVFFSIPKTYTEPFYIRIFDADVGGALDEVNGGWNTKIKYSVYGGKDAYSNKDARSINPIGNYKSGILIDSKLIGTDPSADQKWISIGPVNPSQGELISELDGNVFKVVIDGLQGDDGNLYKLFLSKKPEENVAVDGANAFAYEYSVRLQSVANSVAHIYPFADNLVTSFNIRSFDFDNDGQVKLYSCMKNGHPVKTSNDNEWGQSNHPIKEEEKNKCLDLQIVKKGNYNNDIVFYITNEYDVPVPFYAAPLGGVPRYKYKINIKSSARPKGK